MLANQDITVVVQGPVDKKFTPECLKSIRTVLPGAEIVLSTWRDTETNGLDFDRLVLSEDPGSIPVRKHVLNYNHSSKSTNSNVNRQIVSTKEGIKAATRPHILKIRTDIQLLDDGFKKYYLKYRKRCHDMKILEERVVVTPVINPERSSRCFHVPDLITLGLKNDLVRIWDIPLSTPEKDVIENHQLLRLALYCCSEQYIWVSFLRKFEAINFSHLFDNSADNIHKTKLSFANNTISISLRQFGFTVLKYPHFYNDFDLPYSCSWMFLTYFSEWLSWYGLYCDPDEPMQGSDETYLKNYFFEEYVLTLQKMKIPIHSQTLSIEFMQRFFTTLKLRTEHDNSFESVRRKMSVYQDHPEMHWIEEFNKAQEFLDSLSTPQ